MKVLWFANLPCGASEKLNLKFNTGGWLISLEKELNKTKGLELFVAFYWGEELDPFFYNGTTYFPVYRSGDGSKIGRLINRAFGSYDDTGEVRKLIGVIKTINPDIIHVHGTENNFGLVQGFTDIPVIVSIQGILSVYLEKYYSGIPWASAVWHERLLPKVLLRSIGFKHRVLERAAIREKEIFSQARYIIGRTDWDRRVSRLLSPFSHYFAGNEILRDSFYDNCWNKNEFDTPFRLVTVMSDGLYKGLETIVKTAKILRERGDFDFQWTVIGQHQSSDVPKIVSRWLNVELKAINVNLVGSKSETEVARILLQSDVFCQVSHIENSPNSLCEAMLMGMPIIATFAGGTESMIRNNKEGILIQDGDAYSYAASIIDMNRNFSKGVEFGLAARLTAKSRHSKADITSKLLDTYADTLQANQSGK